MTQAQSGRAHRAPAARLFPAVFRDYTPAVRCQGRARGGGRWVRGSQGFRDGRRAHIRSYGEHAYPRPHPDCTQPSRSGEPRGIVGAHRTHETLIGVCHAPLTQRPRSCCEADGLRLLTEPGCRVSGIATGSYPALRLPNVPRSARGKARHHDTTAGALRDRPKVVSHIRFCDRPRLGDCRIVPHNSHNGNQPYRHSVSRR